MLLCGTRRVRRVRVLCADPVPDGRSVTPGGLADNVCPDLRTPGVRVGALGGREASAQRHFTTRGEGDISVE